MPVDVGENRLCDRKTNEESARACPGATIWHLGHAMPPALMSRKHDFYEQRDGAPGSRRQAWANWSGKPGLCPDGKVRRVDVEIPPIVQEALDVAGRADVLHSR